MDPEYRIVHDVDLNYWIEVRTFYYAGWFQGWKANPWKWFSGYYRSLETASLCI